MRTADARDASGQLLELDPDLGRHLSGSRLEQAAGGLPARIVELGPGPWTPIGPPGSDAAPTGVVVIDGLLSKNVQIAGGCAAELVGPGDVIRPTELAGESLLFDATIGWTVLEASTLALLDDELERRLAVFPEVSRALVERDSARTARLGVLRAAAQVGRVEDRLLALLWLLASSHGRMGTSGVILPLKLRHRVLGDLIGASRSAVTLGLGSLERRGAIARRDGGGWVLLERPAADLKRSTRRMMRKGRLRSSSDTATAVDVDRLNERLASLDVIYREQREACSALHASTQTIRERSATLRRTLVRADD